ncbi:zinc-ribbon domain-containing protein [Paraburkholderia oxyphila]|uniref:zinc-ribbon domain-containing protein n=1 Tax=Paraburkholderia oxyphila TaxID=614212 RepID=UPI003898DED4
MRRKAGHARPVLWICDRTKHAYQATCARRTLKNRCRSCVTWTKEPVDRYKAGRSTDRPPSLDSREH